MKKNKEIIESNKEFISSIGFNKVITSDYSGWYVASDSDGFQISINLAQSTTLPYFTIRDKFGSIVYKGFAPLLLIRIIISFNRKPNLEIYKSLYPFY